MPRNNISLNELLKELGFADIDQDLKKDLELTFNELVDLHFMKLISSALSDELTNKYENMTAEEVSELLKIDTDIDIELVFLAAVAKAKQDFVQDLSYLKGRVDGELK